MLAFSFACLISVVIILGLASVPPDWVLVLLILALAAGAYRWKSARAAVYGCLFACLLLALGLYQLNSSQLHSSQISVDIRLRVKVVDVPAQSENSQRFEVRVLNCESCVRSFGPRSILVSWYNRTQTVQAGQIWEMTLRLKPLEGLRNPGGFDRAKWGIYKGLHARGYVRATPAAILIADAPVYGLASIRARLATSLQETPANSVTLGLVKALTLGIKDDIDQPTWALLRDTGTSHLVAISGLHVSLVAMWAYCLGSLFFRALTRAPRLSGDRLNWLDIHNGALLLSIVVASAYALLSGFELPVQRALIMLLVWGIASWRFRCIAPATGLALASTTVLTANVFNPMSPGFWLSFGTVSMLFYLHRGRQDFTASAASADKTLPFHQRFGQKLLPIFRTHLLLGVALFPLTAWFFQAGSLVSPVANLLAVPWVAFVVVPLCFASLAMALIAPSLAESVLFLAHNALQLLLWCLQGLADIPNASIPISLPSIGPFLLSLLGILVVLSPRGLGIRWYAIPLLLPALLFNGGRASNEGFQVHVLDVGQGLAALVFAGPRTLLFDTGGRVSSSLSMFESVVMPYLRLQGRQQIDTLVVSHADEDHSFGVKDVLRHFPDVKIYSSVYLDGVDHSRIQLCEAGMSWDYQGTHFSMLHPAAGVSGSENDRSCVLLVHYGASRAMLTGDIERNAELKLIERLGDFPVHLLIAPHHGSKTSSSQEFLDHLRPQNVVFPAGNGNRYGFPHAAVQMRYKLSGARQYITGTQGAVSFAFGRSGLLGVPGTWWQSHRRFWHGFVNPACSELVAEHALVLRQLTLSQKGQTLCGK